MSRALVESLKTQRSCGEGMNISLTTNKGESLETVVETINTVVETAVETVAKMVATVYFLFLKFRRDTSS